MVVDAIDDTTAATASAADIGMDADTDPSPAVVALPTTEHVSSFLLHIRRRVAGDDTATATAASAAETLVTPPSPGANVDDTGGATAKAASAAAVSFGSSDISVFSAAVGTHASAVAEPGITADESAATADGAADC